MGKDGEWWLVMVCDGEGWLVASDGGAWLLVMVNNSILVNVVG